MRNECPEGAHSSRATLTRSLVSPAAPATSKKKPCCSVQGRFPFPSLPLNLRPFRQAQWQRGAPEHGEGRWASPLDCLGCRPYVFNSAAATVRGQRGGQTRPETPRPACQGKGLHPTLEGAPGASGSIIPPSHCRQNVS